MRSPIVKVPILNRSSVQSGDIEPSNSKNSKSAVNDGSFSQTSRPLIETRFDRLITICLCIRSPIVKIPILNRSSVQSGDIEPSNS